MSDQSNPQEIPIKVFASSSRQKMFDSQDEGRIADIIREEVLPKAKVPYHSVSVKVERTGDGSPKALITYLLRKETYTADVTRVNIDQNYKVLDIQEDYDESREVGDEAEEESEDVGSYEEYGGIDFVAGTPVPEIATAKAAVEDVARRAASAGLTTKILLGADASVANYKRYLKSGLQGFVNVGHGWEQGIVLYDGRLRSTWFQGLTEAPLSPAVVYFNSCKVHNPPLEPALMSSGARTYVGGNVNLLIGPSERVCKCFWKQILLQNRRMGKALADCEKRNYPRTGDHGISGDLDIFRTGHIIVFKHANFRGHHRHIFGMERNLNHPEDRSLNDQISSFVVLSGEWKFYRHSNFRAGVGGEFGPGAYRWVEAVGVANDQVSSLRCLRSE